MAMNSSYLPSFSCSECGEKNVGDSERIGSAGAGGALLLCALRPKFLPGAVWTIGGAALGLGLIARAVTGHCLLYRKYNISTAESAALPHATPLPRVSPAHEAALPPEFNPTPKNPVDEASWESFPASDPPSSIVGGVGATPD
jgi:hypothetical protein